MKKCPYCAEEIQDEAIKCRYCHSILNESKKEINENDKEINSDYGSIIIKSRKRLQDFSPITSDTTVYLNGEIEGAIETRECFIIDVENGTHEIQIKFETWKSNVLSVEVNNNSTYLKWGTKMIALPFTEGLWLKKV